MSLGTGALQVGRGPEHFRHCKEVSMATLRAGQKTLQGAWREEGPANRVTRNLRTIPKQPQAP